MIKKLISLAVDLCLLLAVLPGTATGAEVTNGSFGLNENATWNFDETV